MLTKAGIHIIVVLIGYHGVGPIRFAFFGHFGSLSKKHRNPH